MKIVITLIIIILAISIKKGWHKKVGFKGVVNPRDNWKIRIPIVIGGIIAITLTAKIILGCEFADLLGGLPYWACVVAFVFATLILWLRNRTSWVAFQFSIIAPAVVVILLVILKTMFPGTAENPNDWSGKGFNEWREQKESAQCAEVLPQWITLPDGSITADLQPGQTAEKEVILEKDQTTEWFIVPGGWDWLTSSKQAFKLQPGANRDWINMNKNDHELEITLDGKFRLKGVELSKVKLYITRPRTNS